MAFYPHESSLEDTTKGLEIFKLFLTQITVQDNYWAEFLPISSITNNQPLEFTVTGSPDEYLNLNQVYLLLTVKVSNAKGDVLVKTIVADPDENVGAVAGNKVAPVNLYLHSLFSQLYIYLNDRLCTSSDGLYAYRAFLECLLNSSDDIKDSFMSAQMFYRDYGGHCAVNDRPTK
uniref:Uncharacterized protein n=1 Tax=Strigamia maritima TaxID=126957 RepID=T1J0X0_STRMM